MIQAGNVSVFPDKCHGCEGKGWVVVLVEAKKCPVCEGSGVKPQTFFSYPPVKIEYTPASTYTPNCPVCGQTNCKGCHSIMCLDGSKDMLGRTIERPQSFVHLEARC